MTGETDTRVVPLILSRVTMACVSWAVEYKHCFLFQQLVFILTKEGVTFPPGIHQARAKFRVSSQILITCSVF